MVFKEESSTISPYWLSHNTCPVVLLDLLLLVYKISTSHYLILYSLLLGIIPEVETSPQSVLESVGSNYLLTCTSRIEVDNKHTSEPVYMKWTEHFGTVSANTNHSLTECNTTEYSGSCHLNTTQRRGVSFYRCTAQYLSLSKFSDIIVCQKDDGKIIYIQLYMLTVVHYCSQMLQPVKLKLSL